MPEQPKEKFSAKARLAMDEIKTIIKRHDLMGLVMLEDKGHAEFKFFHDPTWSIINVEEIGADKQAKVTLQFRKLRHAEGEYTMGAIASLERLCAMFFMHFTKMGEVAAQNMEITHDMGEIHNEGREPEGEPRPT